MSEVFMQLVKTEIRLITGKTVGFKHTIKVYKYNTLIKTFVYENPIVMVMAHKQLIDVFKSNGFDVKFNPLFV